ncbi:flavodoxin family protein [uncultured Robinsoniella sp.]|uniref:flavodoxin family protein n=1 Tax=uncultured Robinsoniella sp. TaxID=904190 RepID=UPI00374F59A4
MNITVIHGQSHKGVTYTMTREVLKHLADDQDEIREFFLPKDGPDFCCGCNSCFIKGEGNCPSAQKVQPIAAAMSGSMKNFLDHMAYRWVTHRPYGGMFKKIGVVFCSSAGAPAGHTARSLARQLKWMSVSRVYCFPFVSNAMGVSDMKAEKRDMLERSAARIAAKVRQRAKRPRASLRGKLFFYVFRKMQSSPGAAWNPVDRDWWVNQGWTDKTRPWKS